MKHAKLLIAVAVFILLPVTSYIFVKKRTAKHLQWYAVGTPRRKDLTQFINSSGRLKAQDQVTVGSLVAGRIIKLHVDDNDFVKKDQVLVELDNGIGYSAVKKAKGALTQAKATQDYFVNFYARQKSLYRAGQLALDEFERFTKDYKTYKAQVTQAEAELERQQQTYDNLFIKAPESGIIIAKKVDLGQMVTSQLQATELFKIAKDLTKMEAEIDVDEADIGLVKIGQESSFTVDAFPKKIFTAKVKQINYDYRVVENVITYGVILDVHNPKLKLRPGMTTNVDIKVAQQQNVLCVPNKALRINAGALEKIAKKENYTLQKIHKTLESKHKDTVWIAEGNVFREVYVKLGINDGRYTQILKGVDSDTNIITEALDPERENPVMTMGKMRV